jgi:GDP-L-fucose synthase
MNNKKILVTGCNGLVGSFLIKKLLEKYQNSIVIGVDTKPLQISLTNDEKERFILIQRDLRLDNVIKEIFEIHSPDYVLNTFGIKGSPIRAKTKPVDFLYPSFKINTEIIDQCAKRNIWLLFVSSVGVYAPSETFIEDDVWKTLPSENDWFPSWSKRMGELLLQAYEVQYEYKRWGIIRPANIFGDYDDFSGNGTVISSTIKKICESDTELVCWGDGSPIRDFVYGGDVADAIIQMSENEIHDIVNFGSGEQITIKNMVDSLIKISGKNLSVIWDTTKPNGDLKRQMDTTKQKKYELLPKLGFERALFNTYNHYKLKKENIWT